MIIDLALLQLDLQAKTINCMEKMFDSVLQIQVWPGYILQLVAMELPATVHCTNSKGPLQIHCTARVKRLQFYANTMLYLQGLRVYLKSSLPHAIAIKS